MGLESSNRQSSLLSSSLSPHLGFLVLLSSIVRILGVCSGLWFFGSKPAEDGLSMMECDHGPWSMVRFASVGPRKHQLVLLGRNVTALMCASR